MSDLTSLGYPEGYHMGLSAVLWWIASIILAILGLILYLHARKSDLINVKEMLLSKAIAYVCAIATIILTQVGVFYPNNFIQIYLFGATFITISIAFYFYYWEKNLASIRWIPTCSAVAASSIVVAGCVISLISLELIQSVLDLLIFIAILLITIAAIMYIYLIFIFSKNVKGIKLHVGIIWMAGMALAMIGWSFEFPPGAKVFPSFIVLYLAPTFLVTGLAFATYGITTLFAKISSYYAQTQKCAVHRGTIEKGNIMFFCPSCGITYCESCFNQVIKNDGCWNCRHGVEIEIEKEWKAEQAIIEKSYNKSKQKSPNK